MCTGRVGSRARLLLATGARVRLTLALLLGTVAAGCVSAGPGATASSAGSRTITHEELNAISVSTAYDVVERLRPLWLRNTASRSARLSTEIVVVSDGQYFGNVASLRQIPAGGIMELRYMTGGEATNAFPWLASGRHVGAAILIYQGALPR